MKFDELGRSMVEMLGVLAIIGVLSVGAIAGYSKAMFKYKLNKEMQQLTYLINSILSYGTQFEYNTSSTGDYSAQSLIPVLKKLNVIPLEMYVANKDDTLVDALGNNVTIYSAHEPAFSYRYYMMGILIKPSGYSVESCRNLAMFAKNYADNFAQLIIRTDTSYRYWGASKCNQSVTCIKDVSLAQFNDLCSFCRNQNCNISLQWGLTY